MTSHSNMKDRGSSAALLPSPSLAVELRDMGAVESRPAYSTEARAEALREWNSFKSTDRLLELIYQYYMGGGRQNIILDKAVHMAIVLFVVCFGLTLAYGVDWAFLSKPATAAHHACLWEVLHWPRLPWLVHFAFVAFIMAWIGWLLRTINYAGELRVVELIYNTLLGLDVASLDSNIDFDVIIQKLQELNTKHPVVPGKLDAHEICNRLMRRENYLIALFNRNVVDFGLPFLPGHQIVNRSLEMNLQLALLGFVFDDRGGVKKRFTKQNEKAALVAELRQRFRLLALLNLILSPLVLLYLTLYFFLRYAEELYRNPATVGAKSYSRLAYWRFREFNELPHYFEERLEMSHRKANKLLDQFHKRGVVTLCRFIGFIAGSVIAILLFLSLANEDLLMHFELSKGKSPIWYLPIFGLILALCRSMQPDSNKRYDARRLIAQLTEYTHYNPPHWKALTSAQIAQDFRSLYRYRLLGIAEDIAGIFVVPYLLWFRLPAQSEALIDFFREFSVHVDGLGYVCSFALFNFNDADHAKENDVPELDLKGTLQPGKMAKSYVVFRGHHPSTKDLSQGGELLLEELNEYAASTNNLAHMRDSKEGADDEDADEEEFHLNNGYPGSRVLGLMGLFDKFYQQSGRMR